MCFLLPVWRNWEFQFPGLLSCSSSKGAGNTLTELLAEEHNETGPAFNALALGAVQTEMLKKLSQAISSISAIQMGNTYWPFWVGGKNYIMESASVAKSTP